MAGLTTSGIALQRTMGRMMMENLMPLVSGAILWGIYVVLVAFALEILIGRAKTSARMVSLTLIILLFAMSTTLFALDTFATMIQVQKLWLTVDRPMYEDREMDTFITTPVWYATNWICRLAYLTGDAIVIWRTWVLWPGSWFMILPVVLCFGSFAVLMAERGLSIRDGALSDYIYISSSLDVKLSIATYLLSIAANAVSTAMIGFKAWQHRKLIKETIGSSKTRTPVEQVLALFVESGLFYLIFYAMSVINIFNWPYGPTRVVARVWTTMGDLVAGLYPTMIIVLVELQRRIWDNEDFVAAMESLDLATTHQSATESLPSHERDSPDVLRSQTSDKDLDEGRA